ncbi:MAG: cation-efflux pump [Candidatus Hydrogenedentes bacterium CG07_land_8_20_14_0_80_42_17]|nr:MAG: cation-efflux pump [Candidatus Hydrogenedentes bacterium CG1_02_42_14]PIU48117.1 MAG: cation-efflux pump [Candidatus Hydrogenedentes bacterium CG07_land_8_20_14_0_80_42_17]
MENSKKTRAVLFGIVLNALLAAIKATAGILGNTYALIADAIESTSDIILSIIVFSGIQISARPPDKEHPYGHGKAEPLSAIIVSFFLGIAAVFIASQSIKEIITPHGSPKPWTLIVLALVIAVKESLFRFVLQVGEEVESTAVKADAWHHRSDAITSLAAFIGISIALVGGEGFEAVDDYAALFVSFIILINAFLLVRPAISEIMDEAPPPEIEERVRETAGNVVGVAGIDKCLIRKTGKNIFVDIHVEVPGVTSVFEGHKIGHRVKDALRKNDSRIVDVLVHIEPHEENTKPL